MGIFDNIQSMRTANYADYTLFSKYDLVTCGWMDFHSDADDGAPENDPIFNLEIVWVNTADSPVLVYSDDRKEFKGIEPKMNDVIKLNAYNYHALIPLQIWETMNKVYTEDMGSKSHLFTEVLNLATVPTSPKLVWRWYK